MKTGKYDYFIVASEDEDPYVTSSYRDALGTYSKSESATLYGVKDDEQNVIFAK